MDTTLLKSLFVALLPVLITQAVVIWQIARRSQQDYELQIRLKRVDQLKEQLREFYDPLHSLLATNGEVFAKVGPRSFPNDEVMKEAAAKVWQKAKVDVIIANNKVIKSIVTTKNHLMDKSDTYQAYLGLITHISMYEIFQDVQTEVYSKFQFPNDIVQHVDKYRSRVVADLDRALKGMSDGAK